MKTEEPKKNQIRSRAIRLVRQTETDDGGTGGKTFSE